MNTATQTAGILAQDPKHYSIQDLKLIVEEAKAAAYVSAIKHMDTHGEHAYCGFAWVSIYGVKGNTKLGRWLLGFVLDAIPCLKVIVLHLAGQERFLSHIQPRLLFH